MDKTPTHVEDIIDSEMLSAVNILTNMITKTTKTTETVHTDSKKDTSVKISTVSKKVTTKKTSNSSSTISTVKLFNPYNGASAYGGSANSVAPVQVPISQNNINSGTSVQTIIFNQYLDSKYTKITFKVGDKVKITNPNKQFEFLKDEEGEIKNIIKYGGRSHNEVYILVKNSVNITKIKNINIKNPLHPDNDISWAPIYLAQIKIINSSKDTKTSLLDKNSIIGNEDNDCIIVNKDSNDNHSNSSKRVKLNDGSSRRNPIEID